MGLNTWAAFAGDDEDAVVAGDVAMLAAEVTPVLKAMRDAGLQIVAIHHHMTTGQPTVFFLHYWGRGRRSAGRRRAGGAGSAREVGSRALTRPGCQPGSPQPGSAGNLRSMGPALSRKLPTGN